jgi:hypothetical protein
MIEVLILDAASLGINVMQYVASPHSPFLALHITQFVF